MKECRKCGEEKDDSAFGVSRQAKDGLQSWCKQCKSDDYRANIDRHKARAKRWREENPERVKENRKRYRSECLDKIKASNRRYYRENSDTIKERVREYALRNPDKIKAQGRVYYLKHSDRIKARVREYRIANPDKVEAWKKKWIAENYDHYLNYFKVRDGRFSGDEMVPFSFDDLMGKFSMYGFKCWICGEPFEEKDHVKPVSKGGPHMLSNIKPACRRCNKAKFGKWPIDDWLVEFREKIALERE